MPHIALFIGMGLILIVAGALNFFKAEVSRAISLKFLSYFRQDWMKGSVWTSLVLIKWSGLVRMLIGVAILVTAVVLSR